jgi:hypothetical protein
MNIKEAPNEKINEPKEKEPEHHNRKECGGGS